MFSLSFKLFKGRRKPPDAFSADLGMRLLRMSSQVVKKSQLDRESDWFGMSNFVHFHVVQEIYIFL